MITIKTTLVSVLIAIVVNTQSSAQFSLPGELDTTFNTGTGADNIVWSVTVQPDGKVLLGGFFTIYNGISRNRIARLNLNGSLDTTFNPSIGANNIVRSVVLQPDGKILIGGQFTSYNSIPRNYIARLNADGSLDPTFNPGTGANNLVLTLALQPDGKVIIGGLFTSYNGTSRNRIARLHANGSLDTTLTRVLEQITMYGALPLNRTGRFSLGVSLIHLTMFHVSGLPA